MGGLKKHPPITYWTFMIGSLAIAGVPLLSGFFSKDEILYERSPVVTSCCGWSRRHLVADGTYMFRLVHLTFHGKSV